MGCSDCLWFIFCCGCCRRRRFYKKESKKNKDLSALKEIVPQTADTMSQYSDPKDVDINKMTDTYIVGPDSEYKTTEDVIKKNGFSVGQMIDSGAYAIVFRATHIQKRTTVAIKMIEISPELEAKKRKLLITDIKHELYILQKIEHKHIIMMITHFLIKDSKREVLHIVMQLAEGGTLSKLSDRYGPFDEDSCRVWFAQMLDALAFMHHNYGMAHRDLKLSNILLDSDKDVLISDFGLSRVVWRKSQNGIMQSKTFCGTPPYMAPEVLEHATVKTGYNAQKADVWALAVILFKLFNYEYPFPKKRIKALKAMRAGKWKFGKYIPHEPSAHLKDIIKLMFEPNFNRRPDMKDLLKHPWVKHHFPRGKTSTKTTILLHRKTGKEYKNEINGQKQQK